MKREQLEHLIRAAGAITGSRRLIVIGSQSILGTFPMGAPERVYLSREADLIPIDAPGKSDVISVVLGQYSPFDQTFGYFGDGVELTTARLPSDWQERLVRIENANTNGYVGLCLEPHDLLVAKYFAGREKDHDYCAAVVAAGLVDRGTLLRRLADTELDDEQRLRIERRISADFDKRSS
jgi:hypothetical protein